MSDCHMTQPEKLKTTSILVDDEGTIIYVTYRENTIITPDYEFFSP